MALGLCGYLDMLPDGYLDILCGYMAGYLEIWLYDCIALRLGYMAIYGRMAMWIYGYLAIWLCGCMAWTWIYGWMDIYIYRLVDI